MRLTNNLRTAFVNAVMADVPVIDYRELIRDEFNKLLQERLPASVKKMLKGPEAGFIKMGQSSFYRSGYHDKHYVSVSGPDEGGNFRYGLLEEAYEKHIDAWIKQEEVHEGLKSRLATVADNCTSTEQIAKVFPEFEKYLPQPAAEVTKNLPALANVTADFVKAGWPKNKEKAA